MKKNNQRNKRQHVTLLLFDLVRLGEQKFKQIVWTICLWEFK